MKNYILNVHKKTTNWSILVVKIMSVVKWRHRAIVLYPCPYLKGCREVWEMGLAYFWYCKAINKTLRELILGRVVLGVFDVLFMCVIEHVLWNNRFLETTWCLKDIHYLLFFTFFLPGEGWFITEFQVAQRTHLSTENHHGMRYSDNHCQYFLHFKSV